jgi:MFS family permease
VLATEFGLTVGTVGLAMGAVGVTNVTLQLPFGYLADTRSRTLVLAASLSFGAVGAAGRQAAVQAIAAVALLATVVAAAVIRLVGDERPTAAASTVDD